MKFPWVEPAGREAKDAEQLRGGRTKNGLAVFTVSNRDTLQNTALQQPNLKRVGIRPAARANSLVSCGAV